MSFWVFVWTVSGTTISIGILVFMLVLAIVGFCREVADLSAKAFNKHGKRTVLSENRAKK